MAKLTKIIPLLALAGILFLSGVIMIKTADQDAPVAAEPAQIASGYAALWLQDYRIGIEKPPLGKILTAIPLLWNKVKFPNQNINWEKDINNSEEVSKNFLYESGNSPDNIIDQTRWVTIFFSLAFIALIYFFSRNLIGNWWALLPAFLFGLSPTLLAHGHYATGDILTALTIGLSIISFTAFLDRPSKKRFFLAGLAFGAAQASSFSALTLIPYFALLTAVFYCNQVRQDWPITPRENRAEIFTKRALKYFRMILGVFLVGYLLVFAIYFDATLNYPVNKQQSDTEFLLFSAKPAWLSSTVQQLSGIPVARSIGHYLLGAMVSGQEQASSKLPVLFLLKEPVASLLLILFAVVLAIWNLIRGIGRVIRTRTREFSGYLSTNFTEFSLLIFIILYAGWAVFFTPGAGLRGLLPILPFIYILTAGEIKKWFHANPIEPDKNWVIRIFIVYERFLQISAKSAFLFLLVAGYFTASLIAYPNFLPFFNLITGGTQNGHLYASGSDYDWGQDLTDLKNWITLNLPENENIAVDYYGGGDIKYHIGETSEEWWPARGNPLEENIRWLAVSTTKLDLARRSLNPEDQYLWLTGEAYARAGTSMFIYKLE